MIGVLRLLIPNLSNLTQASPLYSYLLDLTRLSKELWQPKPYHLSFFLNNHQKGFYF